MQIKIGKHTYGHEQIRVWDYDLDESSPYELIIGSYCSIADDILIFLAGNHNYKNVSTYPFYCKGWDTPSGYECKSLSKGSVIIGNDVWIGEKSIIMSGISIGDGAVIGSGSVVTKNVEPYSIVAGNPAQRIKYRFSPDQIEKLLEIKWWDFCEDLIRDDVHLFQSENIEEFIKKYGK